MKETNGITLEQSQIRRRRDRLCQDVLRLGHMHCLRLYLQNWGQDVSPNEWRSLWCANNLVAARLVMNNMHCIVLKYNTKRWDCIVIGGFFKLSNTNSRAIANKIHFNKNILGNIVYYKINDY